jgi:hypothetical protein
MVERRDILRKAAVADTGAFAIPVIVTVDSADTQALTSPAPEPPGSSNRPEAPGSDVANPPVLGRPAMRAAPGHRPRCQVAPSCPVRGADIDRLVAAGLAATAGAAALSPGCASRVRVGSPGVCGPRTIARYLTASPAALCERVAGRARLISVGANRRLSSRPSRWARRRR